MLNNKIHNSKIRKKVKHFFACLEELVRQSLYMAVDDIPNKLNVSQIFPTMMVKMALSQPSSINGYGNIKLSARNSVFSPTRCDCIINLPSQQVHFLLSLSPTWHYGLGLQSCIWTNCKTFVTMCFWQRRTKWKWSHKEQQTKQAPHIPYTSWGFATTGPGQSLSRPWTLYTRVF